MTARLLLLLMTVWGTGLAAAQDYALHEFPLGLTVNVPEGWYYLDKAEREELRKRADAITTNNTTDKVRLLACNTLAPETYASLRLSILPGSFTQEDLGKVTAVEMQGISDATEKQQREVGEKSGLEFTDFSMVVARVGNGLLCTETSYIRNPSRGDGRVKVIQRQIPKDGKIIMFTQSYDITERDKWEPIMGHIYAKLFGG